VEEKVISDGGNLVFGIKLWVVIFPVYQGFSMFTTQRIPDLPVCKVVRFNIEYNVLYFEEKMPENFTVR
jgi:hypothetical protein